LYDPSLYDWDTKGTVEYKRNNDASQNSFFC
jgi:hypothetical protein